MTDYSKVDAAILERVRIGKTTFAGIAGGAVWAEALKVSNVEAADRVIDRRLQKLRKARKLTYNRPNGWRLV